MAEQSIGHGEEAVQLALDYASEIFPEANLRLLSSEGSSAIMLEDDDGNAFKVYRDPGSYSRVEDEMAKLTRLSELGVAPKPYLLVDTAQQHRSDKPKPSRRSQFDDTQIQRVESSGAFPIIVMEKVDASPLKSLPTEKVIPEFDRLWSALSEEGLSFSDTELVLDKQSGQAKFVDVDGITKGMPGSSTLSSLLIHYCAEFAPEDGSIVFHDPSKVAEAIRGGETGVHDYLKMVSAHREMRRTKLGGQVIASALQQK